MKASELKEKHGRASRLARCFDAVRGGHRLFFRRFWRSVFRTLAQAGAAAAGFALDGLNIPLIAILLVVTLCFTLIEELVPKDF